MTTTNLTTTEVIDLIPASDPFQESSVSLYKSLRDAETQPSGIEAHLIVLGIKISTRTYLLANHSDRLTPTQIREINEDIDTLILGLADLASVAGAISRVAKTSGDGLALAASAISPDSKLGSTIEAMVAVTALAVDGPPIVLD